MNSAAEHSYPAHTPHESPSVLTQEHNYEVLHSPELRSEYLQLTDKLISEMARQQTEVAIFLDKSARPVAWLVNELWDTLVPRDSSGKPVLKRPELKFLNIDREQWGAVTGRSETDTIDISRIPSERIQELQEVYAPVARLAIENTEEGMMPVPIKEDAKSLLTDKNVLLIDEVSSSGDTGKIAKGVIERAFPDAKYIDQVYWMSGGVKVDPRSGVRRNTKMPVWYSDKETTGRLVADRDTTKSSWSNSSRQRAGRYWLSTPFRDGPDKKGVQLRREAAWLADDLRNHRILYMPAPGSWSRNDKENAIQRIERINDIGVDEYKGLRHHYPPETHISALMDAYSRLYKNRVNH